LLEELGAGLGLYNEYPFDLSEAALAEVKSMRGARGFAQRPKAPP
jgi:hypothetical protein